jgi:hypothetical protein
VVNVRRRRRLIVVTTLVAAAAAIAVTSQIGRGGGGRTKIGSGSVAALARSARAADRLPARVLAYPFAARNFSSPAGAGSRLLKTDGSLTLYTVPGKAGTLCLVEVDDAAQTTGGSCADRDVLLTGSILIADLGEDGRIQVVGLVGDGHTYAEANGRRVGVDGNAFVLRGVEGDSVTIGSATETQTIEVGD